MTNATKYPLPCRCTADNKILSTGHRDAGWSMFYADDRAHALQVMKQFPQARMPCWRRIESGEV